MTCGRETLKADCRARLTEDDPATWWSTATNRLTLSRFTETPCFVIWVSERVTRGDAVKDKAKAIKREDGETMKERAYVSLFGRDYY